MYQKAIPCTNHYLQIKENCCLEKKIYKSIFVIITNTITILNFKFFGRNISQFQCNKQKLIKILINSPDMSPKGETKIPSPCFLFLTQDPVYCDVSE